MLIFWRKIAMDLRASYTDNPVTAELYDLFPAYIHRPDTDFYLRSAAASAGRILDLGCGTGRILLPIAEQGCQITGLDLSEYMLSKCRQKLKSIANSSTDHVQLVQGDMTNFKLDNTFKLAIIPFHAFQHLIGIAHQLGCLSSINRHLVMKAKLIFDVFYVDFRIINDPRLSDEVEDFEEYELPDGRRIRRTHRVAGFHPTEQYNDVEMIYYLTNPDGKAKRIVHAFPMRYFFRYEMEHLLERCGFRVIELYGNFDESPLVHDSPEMIFIAEKYKEV
ncbi:MAG: class I SAM-dependent methyltransferase [candidate division Zixibacteria bacterium]|nr:class I SAM-dependent methyltransferase [candidate division Zixibacteria bacterium]